MAESGTPPMTQKLIPHRPLNHNEETVFQRYGGADWIKPPKYVIRLAQRLCDMDLLEFDPSLGEYGMLRGKQAPGETQYCYKVVFMYDEDYVQMMLEASDGEECRTEETHTFSFEGYHNLEAAIDELLGSDYRLDPTAKDRLKLTPLPNNSKVDVQYRRSDFAKIEVTETKRDFSIQLMDWECKGIRDRNSLSESNNFFFWLHHHTGATDIDLSDNCLTFSLQPEAAQAGEAKWVALAARRYARQPLTDEEYVELYGEKIEIPF
jgi:hypothetical protein